MVRPALTSRLSTVSVRSPPYALPSLPLCSRGRCAPAPHHTMSCHHIVPHHIVPHHAVPHHTTPHHTTPHHTTPHHTTPTGCQLAGCCPIPEHSGGAPPGPGGAAHAGGGDGCVAEVVGSAVRSTVVGGGVVRLAEVVRLTLLLVTTADGGALASGLHLPSIWCACRQRSSTLHELGTAVQVQQPALMHPVTRYCLFLLAEPLPFAPKRRHAAACIEAVRWQVCVCASACI